jgi:hypothetical protein
LAEKRLLGVRLLIEELFEFLALGTIAIQGAGRGARGAGGQFAHHFSAWEACEFEVAHVHDVDVFVFFVEVAPIPERRDVPDSQDALRAAEGSFVEDEEIFERCVFAQA